MCPLALRKLPRRAQLPRLSPASGAPAPDATGPPVGLTLVDVAEAAAVVVVVVGGEGGGLVAVEEGRVDDGMVVAGLLLVTDSLISWPA